MENLAHSLTGVVIARTGLGKKVPYGTAALVFAANLPDLDIITSIKGPLYYLHYHRGFTHSIGGSILMAFCFSFVLWLFRHWSRNTDPTLPSTIGIVTLTALTHPLLDYTNSYGLQPLLPFSELKVFGDLVFIVDPYLWIVLGAAVFLTGQRTLLTRFFWAAGILAILLILFFFALAETAGVIAISLTLVTIMVALFAKRNRPLYDNRFAILSLGIVVLYWSFLTVCQHFALQNGVSSVEERYPEIDTTTLSALPRPADPFHWDLMFQNEQNVFYGITSSSVRRRIAFQEFPRNLGKPEVETALQSCPGAVFSYFARFSTFAVERTGDGATVTMRDLRFSRERDSGFGVVKVNLTPDKTVEEDLACPTVD